MNGRSLIYAVKIKQKLAICIKLLRLIRYLFSNRNPPPPPKTEDKTVSQRPHPNPKLILQTIKIAFKAYEVPPPPNTRLYPTRFINPNRIRTRTCKII